MTKTTDSVKSNLLVPPGILLGKELATRGITQLELARKTGLPLLVINELVRGKKEITLEIALALERAIGISAQFWISLERTALTRNQKEEEKKDDDRGS